MINSRVHKSKKKPDTVFLCMCMLIAVYCCMYLEVNDCLLAVNVADFSQLRESLLEDLPQPKNGAF